MLAVATSPLGGTPALRRCGAAVLISLLAGVTAVGAASPTASVAQTRAVVQRFVAAYNGHDLKTALSLAAPHIRYVDCNYASRQVQDLHGKRALRRWLRHAFALDDHFHVASILAGGWTGDLFDPRVFGIMGSRTNNAIKARGLPSPSMDGSKGFLNRAGTRILFYLLVDAAHC